VRNALWLREDSLQLKGSEQVLLAAEGVDINIRFLERATPPGLTCWLENAKNNNDHSPLCRAELKKGKSILLTGDISAEQEKAFLRSPFPPSDYLKLAHHGSRFSNSESFLRASGARFGLVSAGRKNRYGHPALATLERADALGMKILRTDQEGSIQLE
jgi:beta-lactamase superfamily II metal-dependent hydrolase